MSLSSRSSTKLCAERHDGPRAYARGEPRISRMECPNDDGWPAERTVGYGQSECERGGGPRGMLRPRRISLKTTASL